MEERTQRAFFLELTVLKSMSFFLSVFILFRLKIRKPSNEYSFLYDEFRNKQRYKNQIKTLFNCNILAKVRIKFKIIFSRHAVIRSNKNSSDIGCVRSLPIFYVNPCFLYLKL